MLKLIDANQQYYEILSAEFTSKVSDTTITVKVPAPKNTAQNYVPITENQQLLIIVLPFKVNSHDPQFVAQKGKVIYMHYNGIFYNIPLEGNLFFGPLTTTVDAIKLKIQKLSGIPAAHQELYAMIKGERVRLTQRDHQSKTLEDWGIGLESSIDMTLNDITHEIFRFRLAPQQAISHDLQLSEINAVLFHPVLTTEKVGQLPRNVSERMAAETRQLAMLRFKTDYELIKDAKYHQFASYPTQRAWNNLPRLYAVQGLYLQQQDLTRMQMATERIGKLIAEKLVKTAADVKAPAPPPAQLPKAASAAAPVMDQKAPGPQPSAPAMGLLLMPPPKPQAGSVAQETDAMGATASGNSAPVI